ncbi:hypothetical protein NQ314_005897 [Rhamnusium bicolor]|uniref:WD repeat-containing protein 36 n=1 Tax=Rhamnusium bicolor TaxID=1586634 RepID=A0AAV8ZEL5_9CUCU|nr:hypothetical protein NQ314_005897 [Rhamnusium bicolor]
MPQRSKIFLPSRGLGYVSNHIPLQVRYIKSRKENLIVTCVGKSFHTYGISHFGLLSVSGLHPGDINCMTVDAYHVYTACNNIIYAWRRGTELKHTYRGHTRKVHLMIPFGAHLISVDEKSSVKIWDIKAEMLLLHPSTYLNKILFASDKGEMQLWNINKAKLIYTFKSWNAAVTCLEQAPAIDVVAVGLSTGRIIIHNLKFDETIMEFTQDWGLISSISFRSDGHPIMATGSVSGHIVFGIWKKERCHSAAPSFIRFHGANGHNILSCASDSTLRIFNTQTEQFNKSLGKASYNRKVSKKRGRAVEDPLKMPPIVEFTSETTREKEWDNIAAIHLGLSMVTTWSYDKVKMGGLKLLPERFQKKKIDVNSNVVATCLCLTHCGNFVLVGYSTGHIDRFNMQSGLWRDSYGKSKAHESPIRGVTTDTLNQITISGGSDSRIKFWRFQNKGTNPLTTVTLEEPINFFRSHQESSMLAVALEDFSINVIDIDTRRIVRKFIGHTAQLTDVTFSPDSRWLISSSMDCSIRTWDVPSGQLVDQFATDVACISLTMSPTGEALATTHVDYLGIFLWTNRTLYAKITLKALSPSDEPPLVTLPECQQESVEEHEEIDEDEFISPEQISNDLVTLSGLSTSRWQNLLIIDVIKRKNKPKSPPKAPKAAPFFLPTVASLNNIQFDLNNQENEGSKLLMPVTLINLSEFGKILYQTKETNDFLLVIEKLKTLGPSIIDFELKSLSPEGGGSVEIMLQFLKCVEFMLKSNKDFELAEAYLGVFLKAHGTVIAQEDSLRSYLPNISSCHNVAWNRLQEKLLYDICVVQNLKTM